MLEAILGKVTYGKLLTQLENELAASGLITA
jgi:hypothetical protein